VLNDLR